MHRNILLAGAALLMSACATPTTTTAAYVAAPDGRDCFRNRDVNGYSEVDDHTLRVRISTRREYDLHTTEGYLRDQRGDLGVVLSSGSSWICTGYGFNTYISQVSPPHRRWYVDAITRVPPTPPPPAQGS